MKSGHTDEVTPTITILSTSENIWGGSQIFNESLCHFLRAKRFEAKLATSSPLLYSCPTIKTGSVSNPLGRVWVALKLARAMSKKGEKLLILDDLSGLWLAPIFAFYRIKVFSILHLELRRRDQFGFGHGWLSTALIRFGSRFTEHLFSVGKSNKDRFSVEVEFIGNFAGKYFFDEVSSHKKIYDLGTLARLAPEKNLELFLQLVLELNKRSSRQLKAVIAGRGPEEEKLKHRVKYLDIQQSVTFLPWSSRARVPALFDQIRCFALTSHHEGFSTTLLESHARGLPALVSSTSGFGPEFVRGFGRPTGLVFDLEDLSDEAFLDSALELIESCEDNRKHCVAKAERFSETAVLGKIEKRLREHLEKI